MFKEFALQCLMHRVLPLLSLEMPSLTQRYLQTVLPAIYLLMRFPSSIPV